MKNRKITVKFETQAPPEQVAQTLLHALYGSGGAQTLIERTRAAKKEKSPQRATAS